MYSVPTNKSMGFFQVDDKKGCLYTLKHNSIKIKIL